MSFDASIVEDILKHKYGIATWTAPAGIYLGIHIATTLSASVVATDTSITLANDVPDGAKIVIDPKGANPETKYAGTVTGSGPYTVPLLDAPGGSASALAYDHTSGVPVKFDPDNDLSLAIEPSYAAYARLNFTSFEYAGVTGVQSVLNNQQTIKLAKVHTVRNTADIVFPTVDELDGLATHVLVYAASSGGTANEVQEMSREFDLIIDSALTIKTNTFKSQMASVN